MKSKLFVSVIFFLTLANNRSYCQGPEWVRDNTWFFNNFNDSNVSWNVFREAYIGVAPSRSFDFDGIFFDNLFSNRLYNPGDCYGFVTMALLLYKNGGHLGYCHPPYIYDGKIHPSGGADSTGPSDHNLKIAIELVHANQGNHGFLSFLLDVLAQGKLRDGNYAYFQVQQYLAQNDPPIICISDTTGGLDGLASADGHVLLPYRTEESGGIKKIFVYDPNRSYYGSGEDGRDFYDLGNNFISIDASNKWSYKFAGGDDSSWHGSPSHGGRIVTVPLSVAGKKDRLPQSVVADGMIALETLIVFASKNVKVEQITDLRTGRKLMNAAGTEMETDENKRTKNILPFIPFGSSKTKDTKALFFFYGGKNPLDVQIRAIGNYKLGIQFNGKYREITMYGHGGVQHFRTPGLMVHKQKPVMRPRFHSSVSRSKLD